MEKYYLGIDIGTSGTKLGIINQEMKTVWNETVTYPLVTKGFWSEQDPNDWWREILKSLKSLDDKYKQGLVALSFSGQMHGMVPLDDQGNVIRNAILWNDTRVFKEVAFLNNEIGKENLLKWTGNIALEGFTAPKILWMKNNEAENFKKTKMFLLPKDFVAYKLTGKYATDVSDGAGTIYMNTKEGKWSKEMLEVMGISEEQLPKIYNSNECIGTITSELKSEIGFANDVKVIIGGGDQPVNALSQGVIKEGDLAISLGTSGVLYCPTDTYKPSQELHSFRSTTGKYCQMGVTLSTAGSLQWFADKVVRTKDFTSLTSETGFSNKNSILYLPYISGERTPLNDPLATGTFIGIRREHDEKSVVQAIIEGTAFSMKQIYELILKGGTKIENVYASGGGTKNKFWVELIATLIGKEINIFQSEFGPYFGAALLAYSCEERIKVEELKNKINLPTTVIKPNPKEASFFLEKYKLWEELFLQTKDISHKLMKLDK